MAFNGQRTVANVRERKRTQKLNQAYKRLQSIIPKEPSDKMSKINILKLALSYMKFLSKILEDSECDSVVTSGTTLSKSTPDNRLNSARAASICRSPECGSSPDSIHSLYQYQSPSSENDEDQLYQHRSKRMKVSPPITHQHHHPHNASDKIYSQYGNISQPIDICYHQSRISTSAPINNPCSNLNLNYYSQQTFNASTNLSPSSTFLYAEDEPHSTHISLENPGQQAKHELAQLFRKYRSGNNFNLA